MAASNINRVLLTGNLTFDPELKATPSGLSVCTLRLAVNGRVKRNDAWEDKANYFDIVTFGAQAENCARYLAKGRPVAVDGRLDWQEWTDKDTGKKRSAVKIVADSVQFLADGKPREGGGQPASSSGAGLGTPSGSGGFGVPTSAPADDDIPF